MSAISSHDINASNDHSSAHGLYHKKESEIDKKANEIATQRFLEEVSSSIILKSKEKSIIVSTQKTVTHPSGAKELVSGDLVKIYFNPSFKIIS